MTRLYNSSSLLIAVLAAFGVPANTAAAFQSQDQRTMTRQAITVSVDASSTNGTIVPLWQDYYDPHLLHGYGGHPSYTAPHVMYTADPAWRTEMSKLSPRSMRVSIGRVESPSTADYYSADTNVLRTLPEEYYRGGNTLEEADNPANYHFGYIDSLLAAVYAIGAEPFFVIDYTPFTLSSDTVPNYNPLLVLSHFLAFDNSIRNAPAQDPDVFGRVAYQVIKHVHDKFGTTYFEIWNEPAHSYFWKGTAADLYEFYRSTVAHVQADVTLEQSIKIGCCSFPVTPPTTDFATNFLELAAENDTRLDFLSFHPYSGKAGGYDSTQTHTMTAARDQYRPGAELVNAEWGRIDYPNTTSIRKELNYGLYQLAEYVDMMDRGIVFAHHAGMIDIEDAASMHTGIGVYLVNPLAPKPSAFTRIYLNRLERTPGRLNATSSDGAVLAGRSESADTVLIAFAAPNPAEGSNTISLSANNLPFERGSVRRLEATMSAFDALDYSNVTSTDTLSSSSYAAVFDYASDQNNGRLIIWEFVNADVETAVETADKARPFSIETYPNPIRGKAIVNVVQEESGELEVTVFDALGRHTETLAQGSYSMGTHSFGLDASRWPAGIYFVRAASRARSATTTVVVAR